MDLSPTKTVSTPVDNKAWLASEHGDDCTQSITLDLTNFADFIDADGIIPSGMPVVFNSGTGLYDPAYVYTTGSPDTWDQSNGTDGHLWESVKTQAGSTHAGAALHWHGVVNAAQVPPAPEKGTAPETAFDPAAGADHILYR